MPWKNFHVKFFQTRKHSNKKTSPFGRDYSYLVCFPYKRHDMMNNSCKRHALTDTAATRSFFLFVESEGYRLEFGGYQVEGAV